MFAEQFSQVAPGAKTVDTGGEFVWGVWNRGFPYPSGSILPKFRLIGCRREFATSVTVGSGPTSGRHGLRWWEIDVTYPTIRVLWALGLIHSLKVPTLKMASIPTTGPGLQA